jgi:hypothetical protein
MCRGSVSRSGTPPVIITTKMLNRTEHRNPRDLDDARFDSPFRSIAHNETDQAPAAAIRVFIREKLLHLQRTHSPENFDKFITAEDCNLTFFMVFYMLMRNV